MTLTTHVPYTSSDVTGAGTLRLTPIGEQFTGAGTTGTAQISLPNGSSGGWSILSSAEVSLSLTITSGKNYDVFAYNNSGTLTLALGSAWTNDTTRADALGCLDGIPTNSVTVASQTANKCLWLGTIRASGTNTTEDSIANRFVCNFYNAIQKSALFTDATTSGYSRTATTYAQAGSIQVNFISLGMRVVQYIRTIGPGRCRCYQRHPYHWDRNISVSPRSRMPNVRRINDRESTWKT